MPQVPAQEQEQGANPLEDDLALEQKQEAQGAHSLLKVPVQKQKQKAQPQIPADKQEHGGLEHPPRDLAENVEELPPEKQQIPLKHEEPDELHLEDDHEEELEFVEFLDELPVDPVLKERKAIEDRERGKLAAAMLEAAKNLNVDPDDLPSASKNFLYEKLYEEHEEEENLVFLEEERELLLRHHQQIEESIQQNWRRHLQADDPHDQNRRKEKPQEDQAQLEEDDSKQAQAQAQEADNEQHDEPEEPLPEAQPIHEEQQQQDQQRAQPQQGPHRAEDEAERELPPQLEPDEDRRAAWRLEVLTDEEEEIPAPANQPRADQQQPELPPLPPPLPDPEVEEKKWRKWLANNPDEDSKKKEWKEWERKNFEKAYKRVSAERKKDREWGFKAKETAALVRVREDQERHLVSIVPEKPTRERLEAIEEMLEEQLKNLEQHREVVIKQRQEEWKRKVDAYNAIDNLQTRQEQMLGEQLKWILKNQIILDNLKSARDVKMEKMFWRHRDVKEENDVMYVECQKSLKYLVGHVQEAQEQLMREEDQAAQSGQSLLGATSADFFK